MISKDSDFHIKAGEADIIGFFNDTNITSITCQVIKLTPSDQMIENEARGLHRPSSMVVISSKVETLRLAH